MKNVIYSQLLTKKLEYFKHFYHINSQNYELKMLELFKEYRIYESSSVWIRRRRGVIT